VSGPIFELLIIVILIALNGLLVAAEFSLVSVRRSRIQQLIEEGNRGAKRVERLASDPSKFLAVLQLGVTFVGFLAAAFAGQSIASALEDWLKQFPALAGQAQGISLIVVTLGVALFTVVFGELLPKTLALAHAERYAVLFAPMVEVLGRIFRPVVWVLNSITRTIAALFGVNEIERDRLTSEELTILVERGAQQGVIEAEEEQMIGAVLELGDRRVHEVMVPRIDIVAIPVTASLDEMVDTIVREGHSRIPVYEQTVDNIIGILYAKDLLPYLKGADSPPTVRKLLRTPLFVPESMQVDDLLHQLQRRKVHIAVVLDEYGGTAGLVTIEDLLEEIVGEIQDEYDTEEPMIVSLSDTEARIDGRAGIDDLLDHFDLEELHLDDRDEYDTIGGLIYHRVGGIPKVGETVEVENVLTLTVESTDGRRVGKVLAVRHLPKDSETAEASGEE
jgi:putative hemolysin